MNTAKIFTTGKSQAIRIPKEYRFDTDYGDELYVKKIGDILYLYPKNADTVYDIFVRSLDEFPNDFMADGRDQGKFEVREDV
jgi:antitoxin VapB